MSTISIIGSGRMAAAIGGRAAKAGHIVEIVNRDPAKARTLADKLAAGATTGTYGAAPAGDIVILAVPYSGAAAVVAEYGNALDGKVIIDITNPIDNDATGTVTPEGSSGAQEIAKLAPAGAHVVKAFNTLFGDVLALGGSLDAFIAADDPAAQGARLDLRRESRATSARGGQPVDGQDARVARPDAHRPRPKRRRHVRHRLSYRYRLKQKHHTIR